MFLQILIIHLLIASSFNCPLNKNALPSSMQCIKNVQCFQINNQDRITYQTCSNKWYSGLSSSSINQISNIKLTQIGQATNFQLTLNFMVINYNYNALYYFNFQSGTLEQVILVGSIIGYEAINYNNMLIVICQYEITIITFDLNGTILNNSNYPYPNLSAIKCMADSSYCFIGTINGMLSYYNYLNNTIICNSSATNQPIINIQYINSSNTIKIYVVYKNGELNQYILINNEFYLQRQSNYFNQQLIFQISANPTDIYLVVTDNMSNLVQIDVKTGILIDSISASQYMTNKNSMSLSIVYDTALGFFAYNQANSIVFYVYASTISVKDILILQCLSMNYYNTTYQQCQACSSNCTTCDPINGSCLTCIDGYYNQKGQCFSCYYSPDSLTKYFDECYSSIQQTLILKSQSAVTFLVVILSKFASILNICGFLFVFLKLINNWNLISLYMLLPISKVPFFLENILAIIFSKFNASVLETINIDTNLSFSLQDKSNNNQFQYLNITTDFLNFNGQNIILFVYSVILIMTVYRIIDYLFGKCRISIFDNNHTISILDEFVGNFTIGLIPSCYIFTSGYISPIDKFNSVCFYFLVAVSIIVPFLFLIVSSPKKIRFNKVTNSNDVKVISSIIKELHQRVKQWNTQIHRENSCYAILSFAIALLAPLSNPLPFFIVVTLAHLLSLANNSLSHNWKISNLIQKLTSFAFHLCYLLMYLIQSDAIKFNLGIAAVFIIIFGAIHQILNTFFKKVYFIYIIIKGKIEENNQIQQFFKDFRSKNNIVLRMHPSKFNFIQFNVSKKNKKSKKLKNYEKNQKANNQIQANSDKQKGKNLKKGISFGLSFKFIENLKNYQKQQQSTYHRPKTIITFHKGEQIPKSSPKIQHDSDFQTSLKLETKKKIRIQ